MPGAARGGAALGGNSYQGEGVIREEGAILMLNTAFLTT